MRTKVLSAFEAAGLREKDIPYDKLTTYLSRNAVRDGKAEVSWEEAARTVEQIVTNAPPTRLLADQHGRLVVEPCLTLGGWENPQRKIWEPALERLAKETGAKLEMKVLDEKRDGQWFGWMVPKVVTYRVEVSGTRESVEKFFDRYHLAWQDWNNQGG